MDHCIPHFRVRTSVSAWTGVFALLGLVAVGMAMLLSAARLVSSGVGAAFEKNSWSSASTCCTEAVAVLELGRELPWDAVPFLGRGTLPRTDNACRTSADSGGVDVRLPRLDVSFLSKGCVAAGQRVVCEGRLSERSALSSEISLEVLFCTWQT